MQSQNEEQDKLELYTTVPKLFATSRKLVPRRHTTTRSQEKVAESSL